MRIPLVDNFVAWMGIEKEPLRSPKLAVTIASIVYGFMFTVFGMGVYSVIYGIVMGYYLDALSFTIAYASLYAAIFCILLILRLESCMIQTAKRQNWKNP